MFDKILCPTDFSTGARQAIDVAIRMARESNAELVLAHAWYIPPTAYSLDAPFPPETAQAIADEAQRNLDELVKQASAAGVKRVTSKLLAGIPWQQITDELAANRYDACIIGTHGRTGLARVLLGSVAEKVVRHAPCAVLAIRPDGGLAPFKHALVPTDFSASAMAALDLAAELIPPTGSITLLHVIELPVAFSGEVPVPDFARDLDKYAALALDKEVVRFRTTWKQTIVGISRIGYSGAQTLAALDADHTIDVVVMGSHGRTGIKRALLGSVAEKLVRHARCPVLVARKPM